MAVKADHVPTHQALDSEPLATSSTIAEKQEVHEGKLTSFAGGSKLSFKTLALVALWLNAVLDEIKRDASNSLSLCSVSAMSFN